MSLVVHWGPGDQANGNSHAVQQEQELLKNFLDCDGRSQFTYKSVASPYVKQITHIKMTTASELQYITFFSSWHQ